MGRCLVLGSKVIAQSMTNKSKDFSCSSRLPWNIDRNILQKTAAIKAVDAGVSAANTPFNMGLFLFFSNVLAKK